MSAVFSAVLLAIPPAFLAGWILSKALFRHLSVTRPNTLQPATAGRATSVSQAAGAPAVAAEQSARRPAGPELEQLRAQLHAALTEVQSLRTETQLLKEAAAERDHSIIELKRKLQAKLVLPEPTAETVAAGATQKRKQLLQAMKDRLDASEQRAMQLQEDLDAAAAKSRRSAERFVRWRERIKPLAKQFRQQRFIIGELREELRRRDAAQRARDQRRASKPQPVAPAVADQPAPVASDLVAAVVSSASAGAAPQKQSAEPFAQDLAEFGDEFGDNEREDLQSLRGIGPALHKKLNAHGIFRLRQLADMPDAELVKLSRALGLSHKAARRHNWPQQARQLLNMPDPSGQSAEVLPATTG